MYNAQEISLRFLLGQLLGSSLAVPRMLGTRKVVVRLDNILRLQAFAKRYGVRAGFLGVGDGLREKLLNFFVVLCHYIVALCVQMVQLDKRASKE